MHTTTRDEDLTMLTQAIRDDYSPNPRAPTTPRYSSATIGEFLIALAACGATILWFLVTLGLLVALLGD